MCVLTFSLTAVSAIPWWLCGMIVLRDVLIMATSGHFHYKNLTPPKTMEKFFDFENSTVSWKYYYYTIVAVILTIILCNEFPKINRGTP